MVNFTTGVPRSGKSYKAMYTLFSNFAKDKKAIKDKRYILKGVEKALVNINQIDLTKFNNVEFINWDNFYEILTILHAQYTMKIDDEILIKLAKEHGVYGAYIILDECHNYLDKQDKVITWWLSYHGHIHQEIELITQNLTLVNSKYKGFSEFFYKAIPSSRKLLNNVMKYNKFTTSRMSQKDNFGTDKLPIVEEVFNSYGSGKNQKTKSIIHKFLLIAFGLVLFLFMVASYFLDSAKTKHNIDDTATTSNTEKKEIIEDNNETSISLDGNEDTYKLMTIYCYILKKQCTLNTKTISIDGFLKLKEIYDVVELSSTQFTKRITKFDLLVDENFYNLFNLKSNSGENNEKASLNSVSVVPDINGK